MPRSTHAPILRHRWLAPLLGGALGAACGEVPLVFVDAGPPPVEVDAAELPPETTLTATPAALTNQVPSRFELAADRPATFVCRLDDGAPAPCETPHLITPADGAHVLEVTAVSPTGLADPSPAVHAWTVDTAGPAVAIAASASTNDHTPSMSFTVTGEPTRVSCRFDTAAFAPCTSPHTATVELGEGAHQFAVQASDAAGNSGAAQHGFAVDVTAPTVQITSAPADTLGPGVSATFQWTTTGGVVETQCRFYRSDIGTPGPFHPCTSPRTWTFSTPEPSRFRFDVQVRDAATNPATATHQFGVFIIE